MLTDESRTLIEDTCSDKKQSLEEEAYRLLIELEADITRKLSFSAALNSKECENDKRVQIMIRIRPTINPQRQASKRQSIQEECFKVLSNTTMLAQPPMSPLSIRSHGSSTFQFTRIFPSTTTQEALFNDTTVNILNQAFDGINGLVFAYGVTNSGKTYTITGTNNAPGILPQSLAYILKECNTRKEKNEQEIVLTASYIEIYNENVYDLLSTSSVITSGKNNDLGIKRRALSLQECDGEIHVRGMQETPLESIEQARQLIEIGQKNRQMAETNCNENSSRGHCVFTLYLYEKNTSEGRTTRKRISKLSIVDLAGSERCSKTQSAGLRVAEASNINASLMNLMRCIEIIRSNQRNPTSSQLIPFRNSKLTRLFQEHFIGAKHKQSRQSQIIMIVAINPSPITYEETLRSLKYSAIASKVILETPLKDDSNALKQSQHQSENISYDIHGRRRKRKRPSDQDVGLYQSTTTKKGTLSAASKKRLMEERRKRLKIEEERDQLKKDLLEARECAYRVAEDNEVLQQAVANMDAEKLALEVQIRNEIGKEIQDIKTHYQAKLALLLNAQTIHEEGLEEHLDSKLHRISTSSTLSRQHGSNVPTELHTSLHESYQERKIHELEAKVVRLQEQLSECEDEMKRIQNRHETQVQILQNSVKKQR